MKRNIFIAIAAILIATGIAWGTAQYPAAIKSWTPLVANVDYPRVAHLNTLYEEVTAIETELGTDPAGSAATVAARLDTIDNDHVSFDGSNNRLGINQSSPAYSLDVKGSGVSVVSGERTTTDTATGSSVLRVKLTTSGNMADGFGPVVFFVIEDDAATANSIGYIGAFRDGADTSGSIAIRPYSAGSATPGVTVKSSGNVGIGLTNPGYTLHVNGSVAGTSAYVNLSDKSYKKDVAALAAALDKIKALQGVRFKWDKKKGDTINLDDREHIGLLAQEVEAILPQAVVTAPDGVKGIAYSEIIPVLIEAVKEIDARVARLEEKTK